MCGEDIVVDHAILAFSVAAKQFIMPHALTSRDSLMESKPVGSYPSTGIDVLIVGTGLAGLVAALECTRKGHNVRVLERNGDINTAGKTDQDVILLWN